MFFRVIPDFVAQSGDPSQRQDDYTFAHESLSKSSFELSQSLNFMENFQKKTGLVHIWNSRDLPGAALDSETGQMRTIPLEIRARVRHTHTC